MAGTTMVSDLTTSFGPDMCNMLLYIKGIVRPFPGAPCSETDASTVTFELNVNCPTAVLSGGGTACAPGSVPLTIDFGNYTGSPIFTINYTIDGVAQASIMTNSDPYVLNASTPGEYELTSVSAPGNCMFMVSGSAMVSINPAPDVNLNGSITVCPGTIAVVPITINSGTLPFTIEYTLNGVPQAPVEIFSNVLNIPIPEGTPAGPYTVVITSLTDDNQCAGTSSGSFTIIVQTIPPDSAPMSDQNYCYDNSGSLNVNVNLPLLPAGLTADWYDAEVGGNLVLANSNNLVTSITPTGPYPQTFTFWREIKNTMTGCVSLNRVPVNIIVNLAPDLVTPTSQSNACPATTVDLSLLSITDNNGTTGSFTYHATLADANSGMNPISSVISVSGTYYIRKTTSAGCFDVVPVVVNIITCVSCPTISTVSTSGNLCANSNFTVTASGLANMDMGSNGEANFGIEFKAFTSIPADPYTGGTSLGVVPFGSLMSGNTIATLNNASIGAGTYYIYAILSPASSTPGCTPSAFTQVTVNSAPSLSESYIAPSCPGSADGSIDLTVTGNGGYTFNWATSGGSGLNPGSEDQSGLTAGTYNVTVTDVNGCTGSLSIILPQATDNQPPVITCPADITIQCSASTLPASTGSATATDNCSVQSITYTDVTNLNGCGGYTGTITRTWRAQDGSGNTATCIQTITLIDNSAPSFNPPLPADMTIQCADMIPTAPVITATDNCDASVTVSFNETTTPGTCPNRMTITRTWTATDDCNNSTQYIQVLTIHDDTPPVFTAPLPANITVSCESIPDTADLTATDNCSGGGGPATPVIWINEIHYDNTGADVNEFVEVAGTAGIDLSDYSLVLYNGSNGQSYNTLPLSGTLPNQSNGYGAAAFVYPPNGIQNGAPDGVALVHNPSSTVVYFLSYEGSFTATNGPANGQTSVDIGVLETGTEPAGMSLSLTGTGSDYPDFAWQSPATSTPGTINSGQMMVSSGTPAIITYTFTESSLAGSCPNEKTITRTWTATDECGNSATHQQIITVIDDTPPTFDQPLPADVTVSCDAVPLAPELTATDNCNAPGGTTPVIWINEIHYDNTGADVNEFVEVAGTAGIDLSDYSLVLYNGSNGQSYNTLPLSGTLPNQSNGYGAAAFVYPPNGIQNGAPDGVALVYNPSGTVVYFLSYEGSFTATNGAANGQTSVDIGVLEVGTEPAGMSLSLTGTGSDYPDFAWQSPASATPGQLNTGQNLVGGTGNPGGQPTVTFTESKTAGACPNEGTITRTWTATDVCGNSFTHTQVITVIDDTPPSFIEPLPEDVTVECDNIPAVPDVFATDDCGPLIGASTPVVWINEIHYDNTGADVNEFIEIAGTAGVDLSSYSLVLYNGSNGQFYSQTPLTGIIPNQTSGYGAIAFTYPPDGIQNGSPDGIALVQGATVIQFLSYEGILTAANGPAMGMTSTDIGVQEPSNTAVGLSLQLTGTGNEYADFNWIGPVPQSPGLINISQTISPVIIQASFTSSFTAGACPQAGTLTRTWTATDACGNASTYTQTITVVDTKAPVFVGTLPQDITIECDQPVPPAPVLTATDNCDTNVPVVLNSVTTPGSCPQESIITRTYTASDDCGNIATHTYKITIDDSKAPVFNGVLPQDITLECDLPTPPAPTITATDNCAQTINVVFITSAVQGKCPQEQVITRTWTATDPCGNTASHTYTITKIDTKPPVISNVDPDLVFNCDETIPVHGVVTVIDNCDPDPKVTFSEVSTQSPHIQLCEHFTYTIKRTWTATDACGNKAVKTQTIKVQDVTPPQLTMVPPSDITLECDESGDHACPMPLDDCDANATIVLSIEIAPLPGYCPNSYVVHRSWLAGDRCGNTVTLTQNVVVIDSEAPDIKCPADIVKVSNIPTVVTWPEAKAGDYCDGYTPTVQIAGPPSGSIFQPNTKTKIVYQATDECGNVSTCSFVVTVTDIGSGPTGNKVSGELVTPDGKQIKGVEMTVSEDVNQFLTADGHYEFNNIPDAANISISPKKDINPLNGVNTLDLVHITNHILGKKPLDSPFKKLAADVNDDGKITTGDLLQIRKLILHVTDKFEKKDSWTFVVKDPSFVDPYQPITWTLSDNKELKGINKDEIVDFIGIKTADVTWDAKTSSANGAAEVRSAQLATLHTDDKLFVKGESFTVPVSLTNNGELKAIQFSMKFDTSKLTLTDVAGLNELVKHDYFGLRYSQEGYITTSFDKLPSNGNETLFALTFTAKADGELKKSLRVNSDLTPAQAYTLEEDAINVSIDFGAEMTALPQGEIVLFQNEPNPFENNSVIRLYMPESAFATLSILNVLGQEVSKIEKTFDKGLNEIQLSSSSLPAPGLYHYTLRCGDTVLTKKLIFIR
ncbi:MAG TPA: T9SS type A sorting domain-containing protein [Saprospiraceae bacterium]|nr:T9SS type A sorting domain-containing protein [Saprospiraceae bacterium]